MYVIIYRVFVKSLYYIIILLDVEYVVIWKNSIAEYLKELVI